MKTFLLILISFYLTALTYSQFDNQDYGQLLSNEHKAKYYWGTYKPNLYFAMKNRRNVSETFGIMWYGSSKEDFENYGSIVDRIRHNCRMEDNVNYRWEAHNGVDYGRQVIEDKDYNLKLTTQFVKTEYNQTQYKQAWRSHIKGERLSKSSNDEVISLFLYVSKENYEISDKSYFTMPGNNFTVIKGFEKDKENFNLKIENLGNKDNVVETSVQRYRKRYNETWRVKRFVTDDLSKLENNATKVWKHATFEENTKVAQPNIIVVQLIVKLPFEIEVSFNTNSEKNEKENNDLQSILKLKENEFNEKFEKTYKINVTHFEADEKSLKELGKQALSNVLGGIGYFWGKIKINLPTNEAGAASTAGFKYAVEDKGLFTGTPSRSFFARGFLWDEGFHNILISQWDIHLSIDILDSWLSTMSATGWIAREQIRGAEAESQVPSRFQTQDKAIANPPTLIFPLANIMEHFKFYALDDFRINQFLKKAFDKLGSWYEWFLFNQKSQDGKSFQWYGRNSEHNLACGLDDYPRGMTPNNAERHLDLHVWILELSKSLRNLSEIFNYELVAYFDNIIEKMTKELDTNFFDKEKKLFNDYIGPQFKLIESRSYKRPVPPYFWRGDNQCGVQALNPLGTPSDCNPYSDIPCCSEFGWCGNSDGHCKCPKCKKAEKLENRKEFATKENIYNPHLGYVNLFPIAFGLVKSESEEFKSTLALLTEELLSDHGIRSLSKYDLLYHTGDDYWRGNIWMNLNYLVLRGLYKHYRADKTAVDVYNRIRINLVNTVYKDWTVTKTFFEQYSDLNGQGIRARPFNGWTSLILNIISEKYNN